MRDIEGIEKVVAYLKPHMADIEARFDTENAQFIELMSKPHVVNHPKTYLSEHLPEIVPSTSSTPKA
jgi:hypothetical protein